MTRRPRVTCPECGRSTAVTCGGTGVLKPHGPNCPGGGRQNPDYPAEPKLAKVPVVDLAPPRTRRAGWHPGSDYIDIEGEQL